MTGFKEIIILSSKKILYFLLLIPLIWLLSGFYSVDQNERAVPEIFGKAGNFNGPGIHYTIPYPLGEIKIIDTKKSRTISIGYGNISYDGISSKELNSTIITYVGNSKNTSFMDENIFKQQFMTGDTNIIAIEMDIIYIISDPVNWLYNFENPEGLISSTAQTIIFNKLSSSEIEDILVRDHLLEGELKNKLQLELNKLKCGVQVSSVILKNVHLPVSSVETAFRDVKSAEDDRTRRIEDAKKEAVLIIAQGKTEVMQINDSAIIQGTEIKNKSLTEMELFDKMLISRDIENLYDYRLYNQTMEKLLKYGQKYIISPSDSLETIYLNQKGN